MDLFKRVKKKAGSSPGTLFATTTKKGAVRITITDYTNTKFEETVVKTVKDCLPYLRSKSITWINVDGLHDISVIEEIGKEFELHQLLMEDVLDVDQRPKAEDYKETMFIVLKMLTAKGGKVDGEQLSVVLGKNFVLTFQETQGDVFDPVRERLRKGQGRRIRMKGADYLAYALIDVIVDNYFTMLEQFGDHLEELEDKLLEMPGEQILAEVQRVKRELLVLRKAVWPLREVISKLYREENKLIEQETTIFLRDVYDHTVQVIDTVETFRDMASGLYDTYLSSVNNRMSEVMKVLTIIATIFIPLTFVAGIYGMNFDTSSPFNLPELSWYYGYPLVWAIMILITLGMVIYFRKKQWL